MENGLSTAAETVAQEEAAIASITHLPIEEVDQRLEYLANFLGQTKEVITKTFYDAAAAGNLPTAEEEEEVELGDDEGNLDDVLDSMESSELDNE